MKPASTPAAVNHPPAGTTGNLFSAVKHGPLEQVDVLAGCGNVTIERIVSMAHASPAGFWYDSPRDEWVVLLSGAAALEFEHADAPYEMRPGDYMLIAAHRRHRVAWTHPDQPSVWLAVHYSAEVDKQPDDRG
ncbi:cupin domain-containing protein [Paraburkholderia solisilvae]|nr:cupin domain-containing protein [Paraburkholderia solisilvae]